MTDKMIPTNPKPSRRSVKLFKESRRLVPTLYGGAAIIALLFVFAVAVPVSSNPAVCGACHSMQADIKAWKNSSHAKVTCAACHLDPSPAALFIDHIAAGGREIYVEKNRRYELPLNADSRLGNKEMAVDVCLRCHSPSNRKVTPQLFLTMDSKAHLKHLDAGLTCTVCHNRVAHKQAGEKHVYLEGMDMFKGCFRCHRQDRPYTAPNGRQAPTACAACHGEDSPKPVSHLDVSDGRVWKQKHGPVALKDVAFCQRCHGTTADEPAGIPSCFHCHNIRIPHQPTWRKEHPQKAPGMEATCRMCHKGETDRDFCQNCHHGRFNTTGTWISFTPGVSEHPKVVKKTGGGVCSSHHRPEFCTDCHLNKP